MGIAQTGTGKTAAFALPIMQHIATTARAYSPKTTRVLVLAPTRELAIQVKNSFETYGKYLNLRIVCIYGGVGQSPQVAAMAHGVDVVVATPGRLMDLVKQGEVHLKTLEVFVLDEADRMLDMGFVRDIRRIVALLPANRQNLFFSATMPEDIAFLSSTILNKPVRVEVTPASTPIERIDQKLYFAEKNEKPLLLRALLQNPAATKVLVFTRTKHGADRVCDHLHKAGIAATAIHGDKSQTRRMDAMKGIADGKVRVLVATDIAARGIDIDDVTHVVNYDLPDVPETYVHRIGRTARAQATGTAWTFCARDERKLLDAIERLVRMILPEVDALSLITAAKRMPEAKPYIEERHRTLGPPIQYGTGKKTKKGGRSAKPAARDSLGTAPKKKGPGVSPRNPAPGQSQKAGDQPRKSGDSGGGKSPPRRGR